MYGSSLRRVTLRPRDSRIAAREAAAIPLPRDETTPPVTNTYLVIARCSREKRIIPERSHLTQRWTGSIFALLRRRADRFAGLRQVRPGRIGPGCAFTR